MKLIDCYYKFVKLSLTNSKTRFDLVFNEGYYEPFDNPNPKGQIFIYLGENPNVKAIKQRKSSLSISLRGKHISCLYFPEPTKPNIAIGDFDNDGLIFIVLDNIVEILVFKGKKHLIHNLFNLLIDGEFDTDLTELRNKIISPDLIAKNIISGLSL